MVLALVYNPNNTWVIERGQDANLSSDPAEDATGISGGDWVGPLQGNGRTGNLVLCTINGSHTSRREDLEKHVVTDLLSYRLHTITHSKPAECSSPWFGCKVERCNRLGARFCGESSG